MLDIKWLINRLKAMTPREVIYRLDEKFKSEILRYRYKEDVSILEIIDLNILNLDNVYSNLQSVFQNIEYEIQLENYEINSFLNCNLLNDIDYHRGMYKSWKKNVFSKDIDYRQSDDIGDIRVSWEINRMQFMPYLALCYYNTDDNKYIELLKKHFYQWIESNPYLKGINWLSPMEVAIRAYQWLITLHLIKKLDDNDFKIDIIKSILTSIEYVSMNFSKYSSANNHLIVEAYITSIIGYVFNDTYNQEWFEYGYEMLKRHLKNQFYDDGVNKEQALHYQGFVTDAILQYNFFLKRIDRETICEDIIEKSVNFISNIMSYDGVSDFGDCDDAKLVNLQQNNYDYYSYIVQLGSIYYKRRFNNITNFKKISPEVQLFVGNKFVKSDLQCLERNKFLLYKEGGYFILNDKEILMLYDFGDLGFGSLATHGHADALSIILLYKNKSIFRESGTYIYTIKEDKRNYYRGTSAHNTLTFNKLNQSEILGPGLWGKKAKSELINFTKNKEYVSITASHNGYDPFIHKRVIKYYLKKKEIDIIDYFQEYAEVNFILDNNCSLIINGNVALIEYDDFKVKVTSSEKIYEERVYISKEFTKEELTSKLVIKCDFSNKKNLHTKIEIF